VGKVELKNKKRVSIETTEVGGDGGSKNELIKDGARRYMYVYTVVRRT